MSSNSHPIVKILNIQKREAPHGYASWLDYWRRVTGSVRKRCSAIGCGDNIYDCAVVNIKEEGYGNEWYLIPFCIRHLMSRDEIHIESRVSLVRARVDLASHKDKSPLKTKPLSPCKQDQSPCAAQSNLKQQLATLQFPQKHENYCGQQGQTTQNQEYQQCKQYQLSPYPTQQPQQSQPQQYLTQPLQQPQPQQKSAQPSQQPQLDQMLIRLFQQLQLQNNHAPAPNNTDYNNEAPQNETQTDKNKEEFSCFNFVMLLILSLIVGFLSN